MAERQQARQTWSTREWKHWGSEDPMYGVAYVPGREAGGENPWTADDFYATGEEEAEIFLRLWSDYLGHAPGGTLVEIGCGAGRLTRAFAGRGFERVRGVDVSEGMISFARTHLPANAEVVLGNGQSLPWPEASADAGFSYIVFQHFDSPEMIQSYVRELGRVIRPGGSVMIHIPDVDRRERMRRILGLVWVRRMLTRLRRQVTSSPPTGRFWVTMNYHMYSPEKIRPYFTQAGFEQVETRVMPGSDPRGTFYLARRQAAGSSDAEERQ